MILKYNVGNSRSTTVLSPAEAVGCFTSGDHTAVDLCYHKLFVSLLTVLVINCFFMKFKLSYHELLIVSYFINVIFRCPYFMTDQFW